MFTWKRQKEEPILEGGLTSEQIQKERREYVKNIGIEYRYGCLEEKRGDSCQLLGEYIESIELNFAEALNLFRENCEQRKWPRSCLKYAQYLMAGRACEASFIKAIQPLEVACDAKTPGGCKLLSLIYWNGGHDREPDSAKAEQLMRRACDDEDWYACWLLSTWYLGPTAKFAKQRGRTTRLQMKTGSLARDMNKALEFGIRACEEGNVPQSCMNISRIFRIGDGVPKDPDKAKLYYDRAMELQKSIQSGWDPGFTG